MIVIFLSLATVSLSPYFKEQIAGDLPEKLQSTYNRNYRVGKISAYLMNNPGPIFNSWEYGSDLALVQKNRYFIDTRNIIFSDAVDREYDLFINRPETGIDLTAKYHFKYFLVHGRRIKLLEWLKAQSDIKLVIEEGPAFLFEKISN